MDRYSEDIKKYLSDWVKYHMYMEAGTLEEQRVFTQLDDTVNELLRIGVPEMEIREIIQRAQVYDTSRPLPTWPTRRYMTPSHLQEITRIRDRAIYYPEDDEEHVAPAQGASSASGTTAYLNEEDEDIDTKDLDQYKTMMKCPVCLGNIKDVRLSPCGHMMCKSCIKGYTTRGEHKCPICKRDFTSFDKVYYAKYLKYKNKYVMLKNKIL